MHIEFIEDDPYRAWDQVAADAAIEYGDASQSEDQEAAEPAPAGLPADVIASLKPPADPDAPRVDASKRPDQDLIDGFRWTDQRDGWVDFTSVFEVSGRLRKEIATTLNILAKRSRDGKATAAEMMAVDNEVTAKLLAVIISDWSYASKLPVTTRTLDELPGIVVDGISTVAARYMELLISRNGGNEGSETDPASPRPPSAD